MTELTAPHVSEYVAESQRRANATSEQEARAKRDHIGGVTEMVPDAFEAELAAIGERGFFSVAKMRTDTEQLLFDARSKAFELNQRELLSQAGFDELLLAECKYLTKGDELKAQLLASWAKEG